MNRQEFLIRLEHLLDGISPEEKAEALQYYNDYFDDAGPEKEQEVLEALGTPEKVAENIKKDYFASGKSSFAEDNYFSTIAPDKSLTKYGSSDGNYGSASYGAASGERASYTDSTIATKSDRWPTWAIVLVTALCILLSPVLFGLLMGAFGLAVGFFSIIFAFGVTAVALFFSAVVLIIVAFMALPVSAGVCLALIGAGLVCAGIGFLFLVLTVVLCGIVTPAICRGIGWIFKRIFGKKEAL